MTEKISEFCVVYQLLARFVFLDPNDVNVSKFTYLRTKF